MQPEEACDEDDYDDNADDVKDVHCILRWRCARLRYECAVLQQGQRRQTTLSSMAQSSVAESSMSRGARTKER
ncbi:MAG TPA: hypothetical protein VII39_06705, partial [Bradyrhizobium sp.]